MAFETIYNSTDLLVERETVSSGNDAEGNPIYPERRTWKRVQNNSPNVTDVYSDPAAQRIMGKIADFQAAATAADGHTVTSGNAVATLQALVNQLPDIYRALIYLGRETLND